MAGSNTGRRRNESEGLLDRIKLFGGPFGLYNLAVDGTGEDLALTGQTGSGGPGSANRGGSGSTVQTFRVSSVILRVWAEPSYYALTNARISATTTVAVRAFLRAGESGYVGFGPAGVGGGGRRDPGYRQNRHQGRPGAALRALWANNWCKWSICRSLVRSCSLSTSTSSSEPVLGTPWVSLGISSGIRSTHLPRTLRPWIAPSANRRRTVFLLSPSACAAPAIEYSMCPRVLRVLAHCLPKIHKALTQNAPMNRSVQV